MRRGTKTYSKTFRIRHGHTDPAGIVFYPRYYELIAATIEDFFREELEMPFGDLHVRQRIGVPTVHIETTFLAPSHCDDEVTFSLSVAKLGRTSATFAVDATSNGERRLSSRHVIANVRLDDMRPIPFAAETRSRLEDFLETREDEE